MSYRSKSKRARKRLAEQLENVPDGVSPFAFRRRRPSRGLKRGEKRERQRRARQIERGMLRTTSKGDLAHV